MARVFISEGAAVLTGSIEACAQERSTARLRMSSWREPPGRIIDIRESEEDMSECFDPKLQSALLQGGRRPVRDDPNESAARKDRRRLREHRPVVEKGDFGREEILQGERCRELRGRQLHPRAETGDVEARSERRIRTHHVQRDDRRRRIPLDAGHRKRPARHRRVIAYPVSSDGRRALRLNLRRRAEEHRSGGADDRHRAR